MCDSIRIDWITQGGKITNQIRRATQLQLEQLATWETKSRGGDLGNPTQPAERPSVPSVVRVPSVSSNARAGIAFASK